MIHRLVQIDFEFGDHGDSADVEMTSISYSENLSPMLRLVQNKSTGHIFLELVDGSVLQINFTTGMEHKTIRHQQYNHHFPSYHHHHPRDPHFHL